MTRTDGIMFSLSRSVLIGLSFWSVALSSSVSLCRSEELWWPHWRGPLANGVVEKGTPPLEWGGAKNIDWVTQVVGAGASTPIIVGDRLFVVSAEETSRAVDPPPNKHPDARTEPSQWYQRFWLTALNRATGQELWRKQLTEAAPHEGHHKTNTYAGGSPVTDGKRLYISLGSYGLFACDFDGNELWRKDLGAMRTRRGWGEASTPTIQGKHLIVAWDSEDQSRLMNLDADSGETQWEVLRDEPSNWSTPIFVPSESGLQVVLNGTNRVRGYSVDSGESIWEVGSLSVNAIPSPVFDEEFIFCMSGYKKSVIYAVPRGSRGDLTGADRIGWSVDRDTPYVASPLLYRGLLYMTKGLGSRLSVLDPKTGASYVAAEPLKGLTNVYASPIGVNGFVYIVDREGNTAVLRAGKTLDLIAVNRINDTVDASPVVVEDRLYLRSWTSVYCIRERG
ncbi:PQQ-like beta-propeller repeat protein [Verrucomicrobia bacterium]|nr:PQQ-like beta-propeller repeat protein [bacterium]MDA7657337.1 PQQ-like beta-propeller repeat protein [Verrucomicrobiota bacterium]